MPSRLNEKTLIRVSLSIRKQIPLIEPPDGGKPTPRKKPAEQRILHRWEQNKGRTPLVVACSGRLAGCCSWVKVLVNRFLFPGFRLENRLFTDVGWAVFGEAGCIFGVDQYGGGLGCSG